MSSLKSILHNSIREYYDMKFGSRAIIIYEYTSISILLWTTILYSLVSEKNFLVGTFLL